MTRISVEEVGVERPHHVIGEPESEHVAIEWHRVVDAFDVQHGVTHAERPGAETRDRSARLKRLARGLGAVEDFEPIAQRIREHDEVLDAALVGKRARAARHLDAGLLQSCIKSIERGGVGHLPAEESDALAAVLAHNDALLSIVHAQREVFAGPLEELHP